jgi:threonine/homoserine/homoserine lactone efflux protein
MPTDSYLAYLGVSAALILAPGPSILLIVSNSIAGGARRGLATVAGTSAAMMIQLAVAGGGVTSLMLVLSAWLGYLQWAGIAYLCWLGLKSWRDAGGATVAVAGPPAGSAFGQGFVVSLTNPTTLLFFAAFLPQFVDPARSAGLQTLVLCASFWAMALVFDSGYAVLAGRVRGLFDKPGRARLRERISGAIMLAAGVGLAMARL